VLNAGDYVEMGVNNGTDVATGVQGAWNMVWVSPGPS
jgi:hypothetical protein